MVNLSFVIAVLFALLQHFTAASFSMNEYNQTMYWGTYKPHQLFGFKTRTTPQSLIFGLSYAGYNTETNTIDHQKLRYECKMEKDLYYGWKKHDGKNMGWEIIKDKSVGVKLDVHFVKENTNWYVKLKGESLKKDKSEAEISLFGFLGLENDNSNSFISIKNSKSKKKGIEDTSVHATVQNFQNKHFNFFMHPSNHADLDKQENNYNFWSKKEYSYKIDNLLSEHFQQRWIESLRQQLQHTNSPHHKQSKKKLSIKPFQSIIPGFLSNEDEDSSKLLFIQKIVTTPFEVDFILQETTQEEQDLSLQIPSFPMGLYQRKEQEFESRFSNVFDKITDAKEIELAQFALSNVMGSLAYFYGKSLLAPHHSEQVYESNEYSLFTAVPSRPFFPRGFLWDEGFHLLLIEKWDSDIALDIIKHWMLHALRKDLDYWIPREQILGEESRSKVPEQFRIQKDNIANPPMYFLSFFQLVKEKTTNLMTANVDLTGNTEVSKPTHYEELIELFHLYYKNYLWFWKTQIGTKDAARNLVSFRWRGRTQTHTFASGLDDYPRGSTDPSNQERHVDLFSWIYFMNQILSKLVSMLKITDSSIQTQLQEHFSQLSNSFDAYHWNEDLQLYADFSGKYANPNYTNAQNYSNHLGYINLIPFILETSSSQKHWNSFVSLVKEKLWSNYGLTSLSKNDPLFGTNENYWRGPIWLNLNYLTLQFLFNMKNKNDSEYKDQFNELYTLLRQNLIKTVLKEFKSSQTLHEQYHPLNGKGQRSYPFTGWTTLILLIMQEHYIAW